MSAPSSTSSSDASRHEGAGGILAPLAAGIAFWAVLFLGFILAIDPYGVSPLGLRLEGVNDAKPKRKDIDRIVKPLEVWLRQPRTLFLGTSRTHQSVDPAELAGTRFAPAYNAAVPNGSLALNTSYLRFYADINLRLEYVFVELFLYHFLVPVQPVDPPPQDPLPDERFGYRDLGEKAVSLLFSADALFDAVQTLAFNLGDAPREPQVMPGGYYRYPPGHDARTQFSGFPQFIWTLHPRPPLVLGFNEPVFAELSEMRQLAAVNGLELAFYLTPNHAIYDYYVEVAGAWDAMAALMRRLAEIGDVYSVAQPNRLSHEPIRTPMTYWYDPFHYSLAMGAAITGALAGRPDPSLPDDFLVPLTSDRVPQLIAERRRAVQDWAAANPDWAGQIREEYRKWRDGLQ